MSMTRGGGRIVCVAALLMASCARPPVATEVFAVESRNAEAVPRYSLLEVSIRHNGRYDNNFLDAAVEAVFVSPGGSPRRVKGFFYGGDLWKVRFCPDQSGRWTYTYSMSGKNGFSKRGAGAFDCTPSDAEGPVRRNPENPHRWMLASGAPYFPIGLQDCVIYRNGQLAPAEIDGESRGIRGRRISWDDYFSLYGTAGFNLFRFSQRNCSYPLFDDLDHYREAESMITDELLSQARRHGFRVMFGFFGFHGQWAPGGSRFARALSRVWRKALRRQDEAILKPDDSNTVAREKRFIDYCIARWGVYVDFWELLNERQASDQWAALMADYVRSVDPDRKPVAISWEKPQLAAIDINVPHWYETENELQSDLRVQELAGRWKKAGKPVLVGEQGNSGMNWDPRSGLRMRIRAWTALFQEVGLIFWNTSWSKTGMHAGHYSPGQASNIYLGPEERSYVRVLQTLASRLDTGVRMAPIGITSRSPVRGYGLVSNTVAAAYLHHAENHLNVVRDAEVTLDLPQNDRAGLVAEWIDPATGRVLDLVKLFPNRRTLTAPPFTVDLALLISSPRSAMTRSLRDPHRRRFC